MNSVVIDTLAISKRLKSAGYTEQQAEVQAAIWSEVVDESLVSREFLHRELKELEYRLILRMGSMMVVAVGVIAAFIKLL